MQHNSDLDRTPVVSSAIAAVGYDPETQTLEIEFTSGGVYQYQGVPSEVYEQFMNGGSFGTFYQQHIKGQYPEQKVS